MVLIGTYMNKNDLKFIFILLFIGVFVLLMTRLKQTNESKMAYVYYDSNLVLTIDLSLEEKEYTIKGANGDVLISAGDGKIKVEEENSPYHLCSKQGYITSSYETIVCLPNKVVIEIKDNESLDSIVK